MVLVVTTVLVVVALLPPARAAADLGDLLGPVLGGGSQPPPPQSGPAPPSGGTETQTTPASVDRPSEPQRNPLIAPESSCPGQSDASRPAAAEARTMACMLSYARVAERLPGLRVYRPLHVAAAGRARDIRRCQKLSHDACGRDLSYWLARVGFNKGSWIAGEVLALESGRQATAQTTLRAWLASKEHRSVLLSPRFDLVGVGTLRARFHGFRGMRIWVAELGYRARG